MKKDNLTQTILEDISEDTTGMEHTRREAEKLDNQGVDPKEYENAYRTVESKAEELERPMEEKTDTLQALMSAYDSMQDSREFREEKQEGLVDVEKVRTMEDIIEELRDVLPRLLLTTRLWENLADEQHKIVDTAQLARDQSSIEKYIKDSTEAMKSAMQQIANDNQKQVENAREFYENRVGRASENLEKVIENQNKIGKVLEQQTKTLQQLDMSMQNSNSTNIQNQSFNNQSNEDSSSFTSGQESEPEKQEKEIETEPEAEDKEERGLKPIGELEGQEKEFVELYRKHGEDWTNEFYADELEIDNPSTIDTYKEEMAEQGYIET